MESFLNDIQPEKIFKNLSSKKEAFWIRAGERRALALFHAAAARVPAYKDFLKKHHIRPGVIRTIQDFRKVPPVTKKEYLRAYPLTALLWDGAFGDKAVTFAATSGSSGTPFYFPRDEALDLQSSIFHEMFLNSSSRGRARSTLVIDCFGMGVWIGGIITYQAFRKIALRGYPLSVITPGINKKEIFEAVRTVGPLFEEIILCGYPPFIKDIIDEGKEHGIAWKKFPIRFVFAAESFGDNFRDHVARAVGMKEPALDSTNIYGTADLGTMAQETPLSIALRSKLLRNKKLFSSLFGSIEKTPTLAQFNPLFVNFESVDGSILCTGYNALPLIRYEVGDRGGIFAYTDLVERFGKMPGIKRYLGPELPFVYVYERSDFAVKLYGAIIYPEHVRDALVHYSAEAGITGKFFLAVRHDAEENEYLEVNIELSKGFLRSDDLEGEIANIVLHALLAKNDEYKNNHSVMPDRMRPQIVFWSHEHPDHFKAGGKQKWVLKN